MDRTKQALRLLARILDAEQGWNKEQLEQVYRQRDMYWYHTESEARNELALALVEQMQSNLNTADDERWNRIINEFTPKGE